MRHLVVIFIWINGGPIASLEIQKLICSSAATVSISQLEGCFSRSIKRILRLTIRKKDLSRMHFVFLIKSKILHVLVQIQIDHDSDAYSFF